MVSEIGLIAAGIGISMVVMIIGIGGGVFWTPFLILAYGLGPAEAVATSFAIQVVGLGSGTVAYLRTKLVNFELSLLIFLAALPGVAIGGFLVLNLPANIIQMALGVIALTVALLFVSTTTRAASELTEGFTRRDVLSILWIPGSLGVLMGALSVGISEWMIPLLHKRLKISMRQAVACVIPVMFLLVLSATVLQGLFSQNIRWEMFFWGALGTLAGGQLGVRYSHYLSERLLKEAFIYLLTLLGIHLVFQAY